MLGFVPLLAKGASGGEGNPQALKDISKCIPLGTPSANRTFALPNLRLKLSTFYFLLSTSYFLLSTFYKELGFVPLPNLRLKLSTFYFLLSTSYKERSLLTQSLEKLLQIT